VFIDDEPMQLVGWSTRRVGTAGCFVVALLQLS